MIGSWRVSSPNRTRLARGDRRRRLRRGLRAIASGLVATISTPGCDERPTPEPAGVRDVVVATNAPLADFAATLGDGVVAIERPAPDGEDPSLWRPDATTISEVQRSELILLQGPAVEPWGVSIPLATARTRDTTANARSRFPTGRAGTVHRHGDGPAHAHGGNSDHAWLDLGIARLQARAVRDALVEIRPEHEATIDSRWRALDRDLASLHRRATAVLADAPPMLAAHPVFDFLAHAHGLSIESVDWPPGTPLDEERVGDLRAAAADHGATILLVDTEPDGAARDRLATIGIRPIHFDPLDAGDPEGRGFLERMNANLDRLAKAFANRDDAAAGDGSREE
jgi:zinc transport system substrate-binding protein